MLSLGDLLLKFPLQIIFPQLKLPLTFLTLSSGFGIDATVFLLLEESLLQRLMLIVQYLLLMPMPIVLAYLLHVSFFLVLLFLFHSQLKAVIMPIDHHIEEGIFLLLLRLVDFFRSIIDLWRLVVAVFDFV